MKNWKMWIGVGLPFLKMAGQAKVDEDANSTGKDDIIGQTMLYMEKLGEALLIDNVTEKDLPKAPSFLK